MLFSIPYMDWAHIFPIYTHIFIYLTSVFIELLVYM